MMFEKQKFKFILENMEIFKYTLTKLQNSIKSKLDLKKEGVMNHSVYTVYYYIHERPTLHDRPSV